MSLIKIVKPQIGKTLSKAIANSLNINPVIRPDTVKKKVTPLNANSALVRFLDGDPSLMEPIFNKISLDDQVDACAQSRNSATCGLNLEFFSEDESQATLDQIAFLESVFKEIETDQLFEAILEAKYRLFRVIEPRWKLDDRLTLTGFIVHPNDFFLFDRENIYLNAKGKKHEFASGLGDWFQAVKVRSQRSIFLRCLSPYIFRTFGYNSWVHFIEVFSDPFRIAKYPDGAGSDIREQVWQAVYTLGQDGAAAIPASANFQFIETSRTGDDTFSKLLEKAEAGISKTILGHSAAVDATPGKLGHDESAMVARKDLVKADQRFGLRWFYKGFVKPQLVFNFAVPAPILPILTESEVISREEKRMAIKQYWTMGGEIDPKQFEEMGVTVQEGAPNLVKTNDFIF